MASLNEAFLGFLIPERQKKDNMQGAGTICMVYSEKCKFCANIYTMPVTNDGGSIRMCDVCGKTFNADRIHYPTNK